MTSLEFQQGHTAFALYRGIDCCPYQKDTTQWKDWMDGWYYNQRQAEFDKKQQLSNRQVRFYYG